MRAFDGPSNVELVEGDMIMESDNPNAVSQPVARAISRGSESLGIRDRLLTTIAVFILGGMLSVAAWKASDGNQTIAVFAFWIAVLGGWGVGWTFAAIVAGVSGLVPAWAIWQMYGKRV